MNDSSNGTGSNIGNSAIPNSLSASASVGAIDTNRISRVLDTLDLNNINDILGVKYAVFQILKESIEVNKDSGSNDSCNSGNTTDNTTNNTKRRLHQSNRQLYLAYQALYEDLDELHRLLVKQSLGESFGESLSESLSLNNLEIENTKRTKGIEEIQKHDRVLTTRTKVKTTDETLQAINRTVKTTDESAAVTEETKKDDLPLPSRSIVQQAIGSLPDISMEVSPLEIRGGNGNRKYDGEDENTIVLPSVKFSFTWGGGNTRQSLGELVENAIGALFDVVRDFL